MIKVFTTVFAMSETRLLSLYWPSESWHWTELLRWHIRWSFIMHTNDTISLILLTSWRWTQADLDFIAGEARDYDGSVWIFTLLYLYRFANFASHCTLPWLVSLVAAGRYDHFTVRSAAGLGHGLLWWALYEFFQCLFLLINTWLLSHFLCLLLVGAIFTFDKQEKRLV